eukprot:6781462-Karenia_brevis.AAC.1
MCCDDGAKVSTGRADGDGNDSLVEENAKLLGLVSQQNLCKSQCGFVPGRNLSANIPELDDKEHACTQTILKWKEWHPG